jgi:tetratricopeptide (TPR) repeat protein
VSRAVDDTSLIATAINSLGIIAYAQGEYAAATQHFKETLEICRERGERRKAATILLNWGSAAGAQEDFDSANRYFEEALVICRTIGERRGVAIALDNLGVAAQFQGNYKKAVEYFEESLTISRAMNDRRGSATSLLELGNVVKALGDEEKARQYYREALSYAWEIEATPIVLEVLTGMAGVNPDPERALQWLTLVLNHPATYDATRKIATSTVETVGPRLPSDQVESLMKNSEGQELDVIVTEILQE